MSITRKGLKTIIGWLPGFGPSNGSGGGVALPTGGAIGQIPKIVSLNPFRLAWAEDNVATGPGGSIAFGDDRWHRGRGQ